MTVPLQIAYNNTRSLGPDGPWQVLTLSVGTPAQFVDFYPVRDSVPSLFIDANSCTSQNVHCPSPQPLYYDSSAQSGVTNNLGIANSNNAQTPSAWDTQVAKLMNLTGSATPWAESYNLGQEGNQDSLQTAADIDVLISHNISMNYPGGASFVPPSFLSLSPKALPLPLTTNSNFQAQSLLTDLTGSGSINSATWGLHVGSVSQNISGSLYLGGYDQNRVIEPPIVQNMNLPFDLTAITLGHAAGVSPWEGVANAKENLVMVAGNSATLNTTVDPAVPYLYLPKATCDAMASLLPIAYNSDLNLYTWDTQSPSYVPIIQSLSYLNFTFSQSDTSQPPVSIRVPFSLLNLTLEMPLTTEPTPYFPCFPSDVTYLGRAFLQAAFLAQNYNSSTTYLAQAPGPSLPNSHPIIKYMAASDKDLQPLVQAPTWEETWTPTLKALTTVAAGSGSSGDGRDPDGGPINNLTFGQKAGITAVVNIVILAIGIYGGIFFWRRRERKRRARKASVPDVPPLPPPKYPQELVGDYSLEKAPLELQVGEKEYAIEAPTRPARAASAKAMAMANAIAMAKVKAASMDSSSPSTSSPSSSSSTSSPSSSFSDSPFEERRWSPPVPPKSPRTPKVLEMEASTRFRGGEV